MDERKYVNRLLAVSDAYCAAVGLSDARVSTLVFNAGSKIKFLKSGTDLSTGHYVRAMQWFSEMWPNDLKWPTGIRRKQSVIETIDGFSDDELLRVAVHKCRRGRSPKKAALWTIVADRFGLGREFSKQLCERYGLDPNESVKR